MVIYTLCFIFSPHEFPISLILTDKIRSNSLRYYKSSKIHNCVFVKVQLVIISLLFVTNTIAQTPNQTKVLFIGNSFTAKNDAWDIFTYLSMWGGHDVYVDRYIALGQGVKHHLESVECFEKVKSQKWDFIVFQDYQADFYDSFGKFPDKVLNNNILFQSKLKQFAPSAKIIYVAAWEKKSGATELFPTDNYEKMCLRILANYEYLNNQKSVHNIIAPLGMAWMQVLCERPDIQLYEEDNRHPALAGAYLYACIIYSVI